MRLFIHIPNELQESLLLWSQAERRYPRQQIEWIVMQALQQWQGAENQAGVARGQPEVSRLDAETRCHVAEEVP